MHLDQNLIFIAIVVIVGISRAVSTLMEKSRQNSSRRQSRAPQTSAAPPEEESDADRVRKFLEALGQPPGTPPPPRVAPRADLPPRPVAPVRPPRPLIPPLPRGQRERRRVVAPAPQAQPTRSAQPRMTAMTAATPPPVSAEAAEPGAWPAQDKQIEAAATKFESATRDAYKIGRAAPLTDPIWKQALRSPEAMRSAIILREILGPPRGMRPLEWA